MAQTIAIQTHTQRDTHSGLRHRKVANHSRMVCSMHNLGIMFSKSSCVPEKIHQTLCCVNRTNRMYRCWFVQWAPAEAGSLPLKLFSSQNFYSCIIEETSKVLNCVIDLGSRKTCKSSPQGNSQWLAVQYNYK